jgi:aminomethyltransferase
MTETDLQQLPLHDKHTAAGASMGSEDGWAVPMHYGDALGEATRASRGAGLFDLSHLGRLRIRGDGALDLLERVCTHDVAHQEDDTAELTCLCNEQGGVIDCGFLYRLPRFWVLTTSAGNAAKVLAHLNEQADAFDARVDNQGDKVAQLGVVGPDGEALLDAVLPISIAGLPRGAAKMGSLMVANYIASRTGLAGQWALEVMVPNAFAGQAWAYVTKKARDNAIQPCGMAARDMLRMEAGLPRYGHELNETIDPITAGLAGCVSLDHDFIGADALAKISEAGPQRRRVLLKLEDGKGEASIPRQGTILRGTDGREIGTITSGSFSPTQGAILAQAYLAADAADVGAGAVLDEDDPRDVLVLDVSGA